MKNIYELGYWLKIESQTNEDLERIKKVLSSNNAEIIFEESPKKRNLAYPINKQRIGYFGYIIFKIEQKENLAIINQELLKIANILRFIIIKRKAFIPKEQPIAHESK